MIISRAKVVRQLLGWSTALWCDRSLAQKLVVGFVKEARHAQCLHGLMSASSESFALLSIRMIYRRAQMINAGNLKSVILKLHFIWKSLVYVISQNVFRNIPLEAGKSSMDFSAE